MSTLDEQRELSRRRAMQLALAGGFAGVVSAYPGRRAFAQAARSYDLTLARRPIRIDGRSSPAITINGTVPGPVLHFKEGEEVVIRVRNDMDEPSSIHWHGILIDPFMDGVPGFNGFPGIPAGGTFTYRIDVRQAGTYWYHSHTGFQEQAGLYGALVIEPAEREPFGYDREYVLVLSDHSQEDEEQIYHNLKSRDGYYNFNKRTLVDFFRDARQQGLAAAWQNRAAWGSMRMDPTDLVDVSGYTFLVNGNGPRDNWTGLFEPGERVRLRIINASAMSIFDVRIPDLPMTVVAADGQNVQPVTVHEFRIGVAETYDVIVRPENRPYTLMVEPLDRTGYGRATLATRMGMEAPIPPLRPRTIITMDDMGMAMMAGMGDGSMAGMDHGAMTGQGGGSMAGMDHGAMGGGAMPGMEQGTAAGTARSRMGGMPGMDHGAPGTGPAAAPPQGKDAVAYTPAETGMGGDMGGSSNAQLELERGAVGWADAGTLPGERALAYADLRSLAVNKDVREPSREIEVRLDGNMERYIWAMNGKRFFDAEPMRVGYGERVRIRFVNQTMMAHPMHLHGMFVELEDGAGDHKALKHTVLVPPGKELAVVVTADEVGEWAFHCHLLYHMLAGMMARFVVEPKTASLSGRSQ